MDSYFAAKQILFAGCGAEPPRAVVINTDDAYGQKLLAASKLRGSEIFTYGANGAHFSVGKQELSPAGTHFEMSTPAGNINIDSQLVGKVNIYNILAAAASTHARGISLANIAKGVAALTHVPGRFQRVSQGQ